MKTTLTPNKNNSHSHNLRGNTTKYTLNTQAFREQEEDAADPSFGASPVERGEGTQRGGLRGDLLVNKTTTL